MKVTKRFTFSASHRLLNSSLPAAENKKIFGTCFHPHGHNFILDVTVDGGVSKKTGMVINFHLLREIVKKNILDHFDHKDFCADIPEFRNKVQTVENLAKIIWMRLRNKLPKMVKLSKIQIAETNDNWVEYSGK
jgi:6-pyruvoyltetrahydropterin/6-carboxytetrahydropterin synthase